MKLIVMRKLLILIITCCFINCKQENKLPQETSPYDWLIGSWNPVSDTTRLETWNKLSSVAYTGIGLKYVGTDSTQAYEYLRLYKLDDKWQYSAQVRGQNEGREVIFVQDTFKNNKVLRLENLKHDFPKTIAYQLISSTEIEVYLNQGRADSYNYKYLKVE